jgi:hypothetical protein
LAAARERALEVRKSKAEDKVNLKKEYAENDRLKLEATRINNDKLRKEVENAKVPQEKNDIVREKQSSIESEDEKEQAPKETVAPQKPAHKSGPTETHDHTRAMSEDEGDDDLPPHPLQYISDKLVALHDMFGEEMQYKKTKREAKAKEKSQHKSFAHNAYLRGMNANTRAMGNSSLF